MGVWGRILGLMTTRPAPARRYLPSSPFQPQAELPVQTFCVEDRVCHDTYGLGRVIAADESAVTVDFGGQRAHIATPFRKLERL